MQVKNRRKRLNSLGTALGTMFPGFQKLDGPTLDNTKTFGVQYEASYQKALNVLIDNLHLMYYRHSPSSCISFTNGIDQALLALLLPLPFLRRVIT